MNASSKPMGRRGRPVLVSGLSLLTATVVAFGLLLLPLNHVKACSCVGFTEEEALAQAPIVFEGVVTGEPLWVWLWITNDFASDVRYEFAVEDVVKGGPMPDRVQVATPQSGAACGAGFALGERWRVFADESGDELTSYLCSGNRLLGDEANPAPAPPIAFLTAFGAFLLALFALMRSIATR